MNKSKKIKYSNNLNICICNFFKFLEASKNLKKLKNINSFLGSPWASSRIIKKNKKKTNNLQKSNNLNIYIFLFFFKFLEASKNLKKLKNINSFLGSPWASSRIFDVFLKKIK